MWQKFLVFLAHIFKDFEKPDERKGYIILLRFTRTGILLVRFSLFQNFAGTGPVRLPKNLYLSRKDSQGPHSGHYPCPQGLDDGQDKGQGFTWVGRTARALTLDTILVLRDWIMGRTKARVLPE
jgi:hypothetical protein